jgi:hypothetical protein
MSLRERTRPGLGIIESCLPSAAKAPLMNRLLIVGILIGSAVPLFAQAQQPNVAQLKEDAQKVIRIIRGDKAKTQAYCQIYSLGGQIDQAAHERDSKKTEALTKTINDLEKQLGPEYVALFDALESADLDSEDLILSMFHTLDEICRH